MRTRTTVLIVAILLIAGFAALNWGEMIRPAPLSFGLFVTDAPLGAILLILLTATLVLFLAATAAMRTQSLIDYRQQQKTLEAQRELADKAESSRFNDLRQHLDAHLREMKERDAIAASEFDKAIVQSQRELRTQMEQINRTVAARLNELEHRLETRFERMGLPSVPLRPEMPAATPATSEQALRDEERLRDEQRLREEREARGEAKAAATDRPAESGWRRWF